MTGRSLNDNLRSFVIINARFRNNIQRSRYEKVLLPDKNSVNFSRQYFAIYNRNAVETRWVISHGIPEQRVQVLEQ